MDNEKKSGESNEVVDFGKHADAKSDDTVVSKVPWYLRPGAMSGDKRIARLGLDDPNLTTLDILIELKRRKAEIDANKKKRSE